jgi:hypothetical protein
MNAGPRIADWSDEQTGLGAKLPLEGHMNDGPLSRNRSAASNDPDCRRKQKYRSPAGGQISKLWAQLRGSRDDHLFLLAVSATWLKLADFD